MGISLVALFFCIVGLLLYNIDIPRYKSLSLILFGISSILLFVGFTTPFNNAEAFSDDFIKYVKNIEFENIDEFESNIVSFSTEYNDDEFNINFIKSIKNHNLKITDSNKPNIVGVLNNDSIFDIDFHNIVVIYNHNLDNSYLIKTEYATGYVILNEHVLVSNDLDFFNRYLEYSKMFDI